MIDKSLNLFISGPIEINKSNTLFIDGRTGNFITLYVSVENPITNTNFLGLNTLGSQIGVTNYSQLTLPLFIESKSIGYVPLYVKTDETGYFNYSKTLVTIGGYESFSNSIELFLQNNALSNSIDFIIIGSGINSGWYPEGNSMDMYISRDYEGMNQSINLYISAATDFSSNVNLITHGNTQFNNSLDMFCSQGIDSANKTIVLYTHGY